MLALEKLANWWDTQKKESEKALDSFVDAHPNLFGVAVAGSVKTAMDLGQGFVDVLRVGEGVKKGGWGYAEDALRVVSIVGPVARIGRLGLAKLVPNVAGPLCARVSATQALRVTGTRHFAAVEDVIKSLSGKVITSMTDIEPELRQLGANVRNLGEMKSLEHVKDLVNRNPRPLSSDGREATKWWGTHLWVIAIGLGVFGSSTAAALFSEASKNWSRQCGVSTKPTAALKKPSCRGRPFILRIPQS